MGKIKKLFMFDGRAVNVSAERLEDSRGIFQLEATADETVVRRRITFGPAEGIGAENYTKAMAQRDLDRARDELAREAAWRAKLDEFLDQLE